MPPRTAIPNCPSGVSSSTVGLAQRIMKHLPMMCLQAVPFQLGEVVRVVGVLVQGHESVGGCGCVEGSGDFRVNDTLGSVGE